MLEPDPDVPDAIATAKRGAWTCHLLDRDGRYLVRLDHPGGLLTSWPVFYTTGEAGFDFEPPRDAVRAVRAIGRHIQRMTGHKPKRTT